MKTKHFIYIIFIVIVIVALSYYFYDAKSREALAPAANIEEMLEVENNDAGEIDPAEKPENEPGDTILSDDEEVKDLPDQTEGTFSSGEEQVLPPDILVVEVVYDGSSYSPSEVNILVGDIVIFKNESEKSFWPASNNHPTHTIYSEFDSKKSSPAGESFQFKFEQAGSWGFHDHLNPSVGGTINVSER